MLGTDTEIVNMRLSKHNILRRIRDAAEGESGFIAPGDIVVDRDHYCWIRSTTSYLTTPAGTVNLPFKRKREGIAIDVPSGATWLPDKHHGYEIYAGCGMYIPVVSFQN